VELLIVIAILMLLAGLLAAAYGKVWEYANLIKCQANLEQIAAAVRAYATKFDDAIPPAKYEPAGATGDADCLFWCTYLVRTGCLGQDKACQDSMKDPTAGSSVLICPAAINERALYTDTITYPDDPKAQGWYHVSGCAEGVFSTYYWNGCTVRPTAADGSEDWLLEFPSLLVKESDANPRGYVHRTSEIRRASTMAMVMDGVWMDGHEQQMKGRIAARHPGSAPDEASSTQKATYYWTNVAYYDGHVEARRRTRNDDETNPSKKWEADEIMSRTNLGGGPPYFRLKDQVLTATDP
jgi:prepilin-type processing-associated H-X9-DG protein